MNRHCPNCGIPLNNEEKLREAKDPNKAFEIGFCMHCNTMIWKDYDRFRVVTDEMKEIIAIKAPDIYEELMIAQKTLNDKT